jgi:hypothetical protein
MGMLCFFAARPDFPAIVGDLKGVSPAGGEFRYQRGAKMVLA